MHTVCGVCQEPIHASVDVEKIKGGKELRRRVEKWALRVNWAEKLEKRFSLQINVWETGKLIKYSACVYHSMSIRE